MDMMIHVCSLDIKETSSMVSIGAFVFLMLFLAVNLIYAVKYNDIEMILSKMCTSIDIYIYIYIYVCVSMIQ